MSLRAAPQDDEDGVASHGHQAVAGEVAALMTQSGDPERVQGRPGGDGHHRPGAVPAGGSGPGGGVLGIVMKHRVDRDGLQPGIPGAACLGRPGIHLGSCEADIAPEGQNKDTDCVMILLGYGARRFVDDDVQNRAHQRQGLLQRDDPGQGGGGTEKIWEGTSGVEGFSAESTNIVTPRRATAAIWSRDPSGRVR